MSALRPTFWENYALDALSQAEWEALCDGCGRCCLNKLEDEDTGKVVITKVACKLLDDHTCQCRSYPTRRDYVPECLQLSPDTIGDYAYWLPKTCAYLRLYQGKPLPNWHPLISGDPETVHRAGISVRGVTISEEDVNENDWEDYILEVHKT